jgi:hypothetical protein
MSSLGHKMIYNCWMLQAEIVLHWFLPQKVRVLSAAPIGRPRDCLHFRACRTLKSLTVGDQAAAR